MKIIIDLDTGEIEEGAIIVDRERALKSKCHGYKLDGKNLVFVAGAVGALNEFEQQKYCKTGIDLAPPPPRLAVRIKALREAGVHFKKRKYLK